MRLALAAAVTVIAVALGFAAARWLLVDEYLSGSVYETGMPRAVAGLGLGAIAYVHQRLGARGARASFAALPDSAVSFEQYLIQWPVMIVYGVFVALAISGLGVLAVWSLGEVTGAYLTSILPLVGGLFMCAALYRVGSWIGSRCDRRRVFVTVAVAALCVAATRALDMVLWRPSVGSAAMLVVSGSLYLAAALLGLWRGDRARMFEYMRFLTAFVRPDARSALTRRLREEVERLAPERIEEQTRGA